MRAFRDTAVPQAGLPTRLEEADLFPGRGNRPGERFSLGSLCELVNKPQLCRATLEHCQVDNLDLSSRLIAVRNKN